MAVTRRQSHKKGSRDSNAEKLSIKDVQEGRDESWDDKRGRTTRIRASKGVRNLEASDSHLPNPRGRASSKVPFTPFTSINEPSSDAGKETRARRIGRAVCLLLLATILIGTYVWVYILPHARPIDMHKTTLNPSRLTRHCQEQVGQPRIAEVTEGVFIATGYDLANTILIRTNEGHVVVDVSMNPERATRVRQDLEAAAGKASIRAIIYTHSHVDHVGGADAWAEVGTEIWGTEALTGHFFKQYGAFRQAEALRASRQFGNHVPLSILPCSGLGRKADIELTLKTMAFLIPTHTFSGNVSFSVGGVDFELVEAHGETHDHLFVWLPGKDALLCADLYYHSFPNLYSIRGSSPRPLRDWIRSLDRMRRLRPAFLLPSHTQPVVGKDLINRQLTDYRDGIQWVYTATVRGANAGKTLEALAEGVALPPHLRAQTALDELYGQIDWSVRAAYTNELGWFDGTAQALYPLPVEEQARRVVEMGGGLDAVLKKAEVALRGGGGMGKEAEFKWALYLIRLVQDGWAEGLSGGERKRVKALQVAALRGLGESVINTNGRGYLLQRALELEDKAPLSDPVLGAAFIEAIPIPLLLEVMVVRLVPERCMDVHMCAIYVIGSHQYFITIRRGICEIILGREALPGTPEPVGVFNTSEAVFRKIALKQISPAVAVASGQASVEGDLMAFVRMGLMFERGA